MSHPLEPAAAGTPDTRGPGAVLVGAGTGADSGVGSVTGTDREGISGNHGGTGGAGISGNDAIDPGWDEAEATRDWRWIEEWREGREDTPWAYGVGLAVFAALLAMTGVVALSDSLSGQLWLAVIVNVVVAAGIAPALWLCRGLPVLRWAAAGVAIGLVIGWIGALAVVAPTA